MFTVQSAIEIKLKFETALFVCDSATRHGSGGIGSIKVERENRRAKIRWNLISFARLHQKYDPFVVFIKFAHANHLDIVESKKTHTLSKKRKGNVMSRRIKTKGVKEGMNSSSPSLPPSPGTF